MKTKFNKKWIIFTLILWLISCQGLFNLIQSSLGEKVIESIRAQLRQELSTSDFNYLARSINDYTTSGSIRCSVLEKIKPDQISIINLKYMSQSCQVNRIWLKGMPFDVNLTSLNGDTYRFQFVSNNPIFFDFALWGFRILGILAILSIMLAMHFQAEQKLISYRIEIDAAKKIEQTLKQVSHDIRSPLAALRMIVEDSDDIPPIVSRTIKLSVQRINDLANNLLSQNDSTIETTNTLQIAMLSPILDSLISEKRLIFTHQLNVKIDLDLSSSYGLFSYINTIELKRVLSNLINNAVEALNEVSGKKSGNIHLKIFKFNDDMATISIIDNGRGMSKAIVNNLGKKGFTEGKKEKGSGFGLGFFHAKNTIESFKGNIEVISTEGQGTTINISLPLSSQPAWFINEIELTKNQTIYVLDDDENMLKAWADRFPVPIITFRSGDSFMNAIKNLKSNNFIALIDLELERQHFTGLDIIKNLKIESNSILVTSHSEEKELQETCLKSNIKLLPKLMASLIPLKIENVEYDYFDIVLIDNDEIIRIVWEQRAKKKNLKILVLSDMNEFKIYLNQINKTHTQIYIDNHLENGGPNGVVHAEKLHEQGYENIFLTTGDSKEHFASLTWLNVIGKSAPF